MYAEYSKYPLITKQRMFYETMEDVLPSLKVYIVDESGTQKMLPLDSFMNVPPAQSSTANQSGQTAASSQKAAEGEAQQKPQNTEQDN